MMRKLYAAIVIAIVALPFNALAAEGANGQVDNVWAFLRQVDRTLLMAKEGEYGEISEDQQYRVEEAGRTIKALLSGRRSSASLSGSEQAELGAARATIASVLQTADKDREVCIDVPITGSRIYREECLTIEEREERAYYQRERRWPPTNGVHFVW